jgi:hypothetical protein
MKNEKRKRKRKIELTGWRSSSLSSDKVMVMPEYLDGEGTCGLRELCDEEDEEAEAESSSEGGGDDDDDDDDDDGDSDGGSENEIEW